MIKSLLLVAVGMLAGSGGTFFVEHHVASPAGPKFETPFQAVLLDTGQVYYGRIEGLETAYPILRDVFYVQSSTDPSTKQVTNVLIRRGKEWHGPEYTVLNARHIAMVEPVGPSSKVAALIEEAQQKK